MDVEGYRSKGGPLLIVTRHKGLVNWLAGCGISGEVVEHATPENVHGRHVLGALPMHLAALTASITTVDMPKLRPDQRGQDLSPAEMDAAGAMLVSYRVFRITRVEQAEGPVVAEKDRLAYLSSMGVLPRPK